ncbi:MAG: Holliday junction resolvase RuvX [Chromatiales bacterium]|nr:Holliday junction resolvase RuvX [Gammaproteobacteria bacterium]MBW6475664.1 Holliday junction resolvase RuvX [Chromatiales bacterium]
MSKPRLLLGFDFGSKRIGVAVGQELTGTARELLTLNNRDGAPDWAAISRLLAEWQPDALVVGLPLNLDGSDHDVSRMARRFGNRLRGRYNLPVFHIDERLSSSEAEALLSGQGRFDKADVDKLAARLILESWLNQTAQAQQSE